MRETGIHAESEWSVQSYKCSSGIFTQQGSTVVYKEKQINLHNMESVHTRILTKDNFWVNDQSLHRLGIATPMPSFSPLSALVH